MALLEILIAITLGLMLLFGIGTIFVSSNHTYRVQEENARIQEAGRYALEVIGRSIRQAGYADIWSSPVARKAAFQGTPVHGFDAVCPTAAPVTDMLIVQYDGMAGEKDCESGNILAEQVVQHTFFIANNSLRCQAVRAAVAPVPAGSPGACPGSSAGINLLDNVEDLQVLYGIDTTGDQSANRYVDTPMDWNQVVSVRVCILIRSPNVGVVAGNQRFLNCAGALGTAAPGAEFTTAADSRLRRAFFATYSLRNRINKFQ